MIKAEWGTKRSCPKCGTRFYDLGQDEPVTCVECGTQWEPEPMLKSKQPLPFDAPKPAAVAAKAAPDSDLSEDLHVDEDEEPSADDDVDLGGDDDIGVDTGEQEEEH